MQTSDHVTVTAMPCGLAAIAGLPTRVSATWWRYCPGDLAGRRGQTLTV